MAYGSFFIFLEISYIILGSYLLDSTGTSNLVLLVAVCWCGSACGIKIGIQPSTNFENKPVFLIVSIYKLKNHFGPSDPLSL